MAEQVKMPGAAWKGAHVDSTCGPQEAVKVQEWGGQQRAIKSWALCMAPPLCHGERTCMGAGQVSFPLSLHACLQLLLMSQI